MPGDPNTELVGAELEALRGHLNGDHHSAPDAWNLEADGAFANTGEQGRTQPRPIRFQSFGEIEPEPDEWLLHGILPLTGLAAIFGASGAAKTFLALDWCLRIAARMDIMGEQPEWRGVAYVAGEGGNGVRKRVRAFRQHHEIGGELPFVLTTSPLDLRSPKAEDIERLIAELKAWRPWFNERGTALSVVALDTLASLTPGADEKSSEGMGAALAACMRIASELGVLVVIVHHVGHEKRDRERGWSGFRAALDASILVERDDASNVRSVRLVKAKDGPDARLLAEFMLTPVVIGQDRRGRDLVSCVIERYEPPGAASRPQQTNRKSPPAGVKTVRTALAQLISESGRRPPSICQAGREFAVPKEELKQRARSLGLCGDSVKDPQGSSLRAFNRARLWLIESGEVFEREGWVWFAPPRLDDQDSTRTRSRVS